MDSDSSSFAIVRFIILPEIAIPALVKGLGHADPMAREGAVYGLGAFGAAALNAVPELKKAAGNETDEDLKELILQTARGITSAAAVPGNLLY